jgi:hypothetical protein
MAKYTPTLLGKDTEINIAPFFGGGFVDAGAAQLNQAIQNNAQAVTEAKNKKFEQAQALRDGIVSGHFSDIMAAEVGEDIAKLATMGTYSEAYAVTLAEANAKLGVNVAKQAQITTKAEEITNQFKEDPSNKYYNRNALGENLGNTIESGGLDTQMIDLDNSLINFKGNVANIKDGIVRQDFQKQLGEITRKAVANGDIKSANSAYYKLNQTTDGSKFLSGFSVYDAENGMYVPNFDQTKLPPMGLVEMYKGLDPAAATLMENAVAKMKADKNVADKDFTDELKKNYEQRFLLNEMRKMAPGGGQTSEDTNQFLSKPQDRTTPDDTPSYDDMENYEMVKDAVNGMADLVNLNPNDFINDNVSYETVNIDGVDVRTLDVTGSGSGTNHRVAIYNVLDNNGNTNREYKEPRKVLLSMDASGDQTIYFVGGTESQPTYNKLNRRNASDFILRMANDNFGGGATGITAFKSFYKIAKDKNEINRDGSYTQFGSFNATDDNVLSNEIDNTNEARNTANSGPAYTTQELNNMFETSDIPTINEKLIEINQDNLNNVRIYNTLESKSDGKVNDGKKFKVVHFKRPDDNRQFYNFNNSWGVLTYQNVEGNGQYGEPQTIKVKTKDYFNLIGAPGSADFNVNPTER